MRLPSGHPWWQNGTPQSMHRAAWSRSSPSAYGRYTSCQSWTRSRTGRYGCFCRWISMNPVALPMNDLEIREHDWNDFHLAEQRLAFEHALVVARHHFDEHLRGDRPIRQDFRGERAACVSQMTLQQLFHELVVGVLFKRLELDEFRVAPRRKRRRRIVDVRDAAAHTGGEVASRLPQDDDATARHIFASV